jgi:hypothetical protein
MILKPILQHYTDTMHFHWEKRSSERNSPIFKLENPIKFAQDFIKVTFLGLIKITHNGEYCRIVISGETEYNGYTTLYDVSDDIQENMYGALHDFFNQLLPEDIKDLMERNGEKI